MIYVFQNIRTGDFFACKEGLLIPSGSIIIGACKTDAEATTMISIHQASQGSYIKKQRNSEV